MQTWKRTRSRLAYQQPKKARRLSVPAMLTGFMLAGAAGVGYTSGGVSLDSLKVMAPGSGCSIKGNISLNTGERIYHVPGQKYYSQTRISLEHGERWFCSEDEARRAGWRKSRS